MPADSQTTAPFCLDEAQKAADEWGMNCGPGAIAAVVGLTPAAVRPHLGDFEVKGHTNPTLMWRILQSLGVQFSYRGGDLGRENWPVYGLARIQWEGPWTRPSVPARVAYGHTHWVGAERRQDGQWVFDINAMSVGGWLPAAEWCGELVPWLLRECHPKASGRWHITHAVEVNRQSIRCAA